MVWQYIKITTSGSYERKKGIFIFVEFYVLSTSLWLSLEILRIGSTLHRRLKTTTIFDQYSYIGFFCLRRVMTPFNQLRVRLKTLPFVRQRKNADTAQDHQQDLSHIVHSHNCSFLSSLVISLFSIAPEK